MSISQHSVCLNYYQMARQNRKVADRLKALKPTAPDPQLLLAFLRELYKAGGGQPITCTITDHYRTRIFEFAHVDIKVENNDLHQLLYDSPIIHAYITTDISDYFLHKTPTKHYSISPPLREKIIEAGEELLQLKKDGRFRAYLVVEEQNKLSPVTMSNGECMTFEEVQEKDGKQIPLLTGGRKGEQFIAALHGVGGVWPELPDNEDIVNMILAAVRVGHDTTDPICKYIDQSCLVTEDGRFVSMIPPGNISARLSSITSMDACTYRKRVLEIRKAIDKMKPDLKIPHIQLLVDSMYRDEYKDDAFDRLHYLRLCQSLEEAKKYLDYNVDVRTDSNIVAGNKPLNKLVDYRDNIAHWWVGESDEEFLVNLQKTINQLVRQKYS